MANHSSVLAWETPWTEEPGSLQSVGLQTDTTEHQQELDIQKLKILFLNNERNCQKVGSFEANDEGRTPIKESTKWENCQNTLIALSFGAYNFHV